MIYRTKKPLWFVINHLIYKMVCMKNLICIYGLCHLVDLQSFSRLLAMNQTERISKDYGTLDEKIARLRTIDAIGFAYLHRR